MALGFCLHFTQQPNLVEPRLYNFCCIVTNFISSTKFCVVIQINYRLMMINMMTLALYHSDLIKRWCYAEWAKCQPCPKVTMKNLLPTNFIWIFDFIALLQLYRNVYKYLHINACLRTFSKLSSVHVKTVMNMASGGTVWCFSFHVLLTVLEV